MKKAALFGVIIAALSLGFGAVFATPAANAARVSGATVYPQSGNPGWGDIEYITATSDGIVIKLTGTGLSRANGSGAWNVADEAAWLYRQVPIQYRPWYDIGWAREPLGREIRYHAAAYWCCSWLRGHANPVNARFSDYWSGLGSLMWWID